MAREKMSVPKFTRLPKTHLSGISEQEVGFNFQHLSFVSFSPTLSLLIDCYKQLDTIFQIIYVN